MNTQPPEVDSTLLDLLVCPVDQGQLLYIREENVLYNPRLKKSYEIVDSIPVMLEEETSDVDEATHETYLARVTRLTGKE